MEDVDSVADLRVDDIVVAVMGPNRSGKSTVCKTRLLIAIKGGMNSTNRTVSKFIDALTPTLPQLPQSQSKKKKSSSQGTTATTTTTSTATWGLQVSSSPPLPSSSPSCSFAQNELNAVRVLHHVEFGDRLVLVDIPGFDNKERTDMEILEMVAGWLESTYKRSIRLAGILYLHRITDAPLLSGSPQRNLMMFGNLCGDQAVRKVVIVTTMWNLIDPIVGERRQSELEYRYFGELIRKGAVCMRFDGTYRAAWEIMEALFFASENEGEKSKKPRRRRRREVGNGSATVPLLIQEEVVDLNKRLNETSAGQALYHTVQSQIAQQKAVVKELMRLAKEQHNKKLEKELRVEYKRVQAEFERSIGAKVSVLRISLVRRLVLFFRRKKARARSLNLVY